MTVKMRNKGQQPCGFRATCPSHAVDGKFHSPRENADVDRHHIEKPQAQWRSLQGDGTGRFAALRNVTDRTKLEQAQALALQHLDTLLACAPFGFVFLDRDLRFVRINDRLAEMNGYSVAAHLGRTVAEIVPALEATLREVTVRILATGQPVLNHEFSGETAREPGVTRHWNESWYPVNDERGEIVGFGAVVEDVTERKQAEAALRLTNDRFELAVKASQAVLWQQDMDLRFTWLHNPAPGIDGSNAVGKREADLLERAEDVAVIEGLKREVIRSGVGLRQEFFPQIQGVIHCFELLMEPLRDAAGLITGLTGAATDITERKRVEVALRENERHYRALAEASLEIPYRMSADWSTLLPLEGRNLVTRSDCPLDHWAWLDRNLPPEEHARVRQAISDAIAEKGLFELEHRVLRADGSTGWTFSRAVPILDESENLVTWFGAASDITERKRVEEERRLLASIVENSRDFIGVADMHGNPVYGNRAAMELVGVKDLEQVRRSKIIDYFIAEQRQFVEEVVLPAVATDGRWSGELTMQHFVTGATFPVWYDLFRVDDPVTGQLVNFATITRDLTESKRTEKALAERTELLNGVLEGTTDVIFVKDLKGRLLLVNTACAALVGSSTEQVVGKTGEELLPPDLAAAMRQHDEAVIAGGTPIELEETFLVAGEARVFLTLKAPLRDSSRRVIGILGISRDITERKRNELNLIEATAVAEKANRAKSDFLSGMSHELRTPLNAILGFAQLMESGAVAPTPAQSRYLKQIIKGGWYLLDLINELLDLAQIESGKLSLTQESVSLAEVMLECQAMIEPQASERAITMTFPTLALPGYVRGDRTRVKQVVINLLSNAIKYNKAPGAVTVEIALSPPDAIRVSIRDTGEGLAPEKLAQLFQPFNRLGREAGFEEGTGIGLVMSRRLVELMGGSIGVDSEVGVGSVFWFELKWESA